MAARKRKAQEEDFVLYKRHQQIHTYSFQLANHTTVYQAELEAIYQACVYIDNNITSLKPKYIKILTDSQAALQTLNSIDFTSTIALKTAEALENLI